ncbi:MAG: pyridoxal-phosphate dependent enzyme, partial [Myxococcales bacterium]|nr:pyridoxal-phosphate dependent enzyme [Myxococcales bacterium]
MVDEVALVPVEEVEAARRGLAGVLRPTPTWPDRALGLLCHRTVLAKHEHLQRTGSFKFRGAHHLISGLGPHQDLVVAASAGNHAQGVALAAQLQGKRAVVFMPAGA